ncbi:MAG: hypothetical protein V4574_06105 [Pseudomonadota bacterium]
MKARIVRKAAAGAARAGAERGAVREGLGERDAPVLLDAAKDEKAPAPEGAEPAARAPEPKLPVKAGGQPSDAEKKAHAQLRPEKKPKP